MLLTCKVADHKDIKYFNVLLIMIGIIQYLMVQLCIGLKDLHNRLVHVCFSLS